MHAACAPFSRSGSNIVNEFKRFKHTIKSYSGNHFPTKIFFAKVPLFKKKTCCLAIIVEQILMENTFGFANGTLKIP